MAEVLAEAGGTPGGEALAEHHVPDAPVDAAFQTEEAAEPSRDPIGDAVKRAEARMAKTAPDQAADAKPADAAKAADAKPEPRTERGADGKFKAAPTEGDADRPSESKQEPSRASAHREPPSRFDDAAKAEWEGLPENTRGAVHRMQRELEAGIEKYKASADEFETVREYADMARQGGTDLKTALRRYVTMENELRRDPIAGLQAVVANLGLKGPNGQPATLRDVAAFVLGQKPDQAASRQDAIIAELRREIATMKESFGGLSEHVRAQQSAATEHAILGEFDAFVRANPNARHMEAEIADFLTRYPASGNIPLRERLADALAWAESRFPDRMAAHTRVDDVAAQTRDRPARQVNPAGAKSISGAPRGSQPSSPRITSFDDAINSAMRQLGI